MEVMLSMPQVISVGFGLVGFGSAISAFYIKGTIADTIITKLNGRYVAKPLCQQLHVGIAEQVREVKSKLSDIEEKSDHNMEELRRELHSMLLRRPSNKQMTTD